MARTEIHLSDGRPRTVGSFGNPNDLSAARAEGVPQSCDLAEIRLDLLPTGSDALIARPWRHLSGLPLLFTARRLEEGGAVPADAAARTAMLSPALDDASLVDIEVASIDEMPELLESLRARGIPWIASFHDFEKLPARTTLEQAAARARGAGASAFKAAARLHDLKDITALAEFQLTDHGLPVATMGMGALAPVSRLLCAQCGSVLNYGFLGTNPTAPGQWDAALLKQAVARLAPFSP